MTTVMLKSHPTSFKGTTLSSNFIFFTYHHGNYSEVGKNTFIWPQMYYDGTISRWRKGTSCLNALRKFSVKFQETLNFLKSVITCVIWSLWFRQSRIYLTVYIMNSTVISASHKRLVYNIVLGKHWRI